MVCTISPTYLFISDIKTQIPVLVEISFLINVNYNFYTISYIQFTSLVSLLKSHCIKIATDRAVYSQRGRPLLKEWLEWLLINIQCGVSDQTPPQHMRSFFRISIVNNPEFRIKEFGMYKVLLYTVCTSFKTLDSLELYLNS